jgi:CheY-like chemotaxis protein
MNLEQNCSFLINGEKAYIESIDIIDEELKSLEQRMKDNPLQEIQTCRPIALMLLDLQMPRMTGLQVIEKLRSFISKRNMQS